MNLVAVVVHACPPDGSGLMPCCGLTPFEVPPTDAMTLDPAKVTCASATEPPIKAEGTETP